MLQVERDERFIFNDENVLASKHAMPLLAAQHPWHRSSPCSRLQAPETQRRPISRSPRGMRIVVALLDEVDLGRQIACNLEADRLLADLWLVPNLHW